MGPLDKDDEIDDIIEQDDNEDAVPTDVRGAIKHAIKTESDRAEDEPGSEEKEEDTKPVRDAKKTGEVSNKRAPKEQSTSAKDDNAENEDDDKELASDKKEEKKLVAPPGWTKEGKATWDKLPPDAQASVIKREEEVSRGIAQYAQKARAYDEFAQVIAPRQEAIQRFGASPAQVVDRLFQWMEALSHPDVKYKANSFKALAQSFGLPLAQLVSQSPELSDATPEPDTNNNPPQWFEQFAQTVQGEVGGLKEQLAAQRQVAASNALNSWASAKDKDGTPLRPHFNQVRQLMYQLIGGGVVPMKDGEIDLDGAYEQAVKLNPEVSAQIQQEAAAKEKAEAAAQAKKDASAAAARAAKARIAGSGLKPAAPSLSASKPNSKPNGAGNKPMSVKESLRKSLDELRE